MLFTVLAALVLVAFDQLTKYAATLYLAPVGSMPFIPGIMELRYILNDGAAFSILSGNRWFLIVITGLALAGLGWYLLFRKPQDKVMYFALLLVFAGGIGNLIDRVLNGAVVDFFATTFMNFAVFNVADCFVCVGMALLIFAVIRDEISAKKKKSDAEN